MLIEIKLLKYSNRLVAKQTFYVPDDMPPETFRKILEHIEVECQKCCDKKEKPEKPEE